MRDGDRALIIHRNTLWRTAFAVVAAGGLVAGSARSAPQAPADPDLAGFPPGYILSCSEAPRAAVVVVPPPFNAYMRVICTKVAAALAPVRGFHWAFSNGTSGFLTALNPKSAVTGPEAYFTRLANAPLTAAEIAAFRARLKPVVKNPAILSAEVLRLQVDTSTDDHKQEYLLVAHNAAGAVTGAWGIECYDDCNPMEAQPWAFTVLPDQK